MYLLLSTVCIKHPHSKWMQLANRGYLVALAVDAIRVLSDSIKPAALVLKVQNLQLHRAWIWTVQSDLQ